MRWLRRMLLSVRQIQSALHELKDRIDKDPKYKDVKNWLESLPKI